MTGKKDISLLEKHAQTILTGVVAGLIGWVGISVAEQSKQIAVLSEQMNGMKLQIEEFRIFARQPRLTKDDFLILIEPYSQRVEINNEKLLKQERQVSEIEKRLNSLERSK